MEIELSKLLLALLAGVITVFTPCTFPFLPVIVGRSLGSRSWKKPLVILISLAISLFIFGVIFSVSLKVFGFNKQTLTFWGGAMIALFGYVTLVPESWDKLMEKLGFFKASKKAMQSGVEKNSYIGDILVGFSLGPVFTGCSPVLIAILPLISESSKIVGSTYLLTYILGLCGFLGLIAFFGQKMTKRLGFATNPLGMFKRHLGIILLVIGVLIMSGGDKKFETWLIEHNLDVFTSIESRLGNEFTE